ncbi:MAG TPA: P-loop NTPase [Candidatus Polarisedimenticolaceae bacterium]|nr:P-loop NTPase [Candidatus Polarisedimenticolaceae bacterium]
MKSYHDIAGDGGSRIAEQVEAGRGKIAQALFGVRHRVAVGSGKGGVGKSALTRALASALAARGLSVAILDADLNGPTQARMSGLAGAVPVPGPEGLALPRSSDGVRVFSIGEMIPESQSLEFASVAAGDAHTWRATKEFAVLGELLGSIAWGRLDVLLFDLPPGAERTSQFVDFLGAETSLVLVTIPSEVSRGVVARSLAAVSKSSCRVAGYVENMSGYLCADCGEVKPLFPESREVPLDLPLLGRVPFDPALAAACDRGEPFSSRPLQDVADRLIAFLESPR